MAALFLAGQTQAATYWKAYNDHGLGTVGTQTHANATTLNCLQAGSVNLKDITTGTDIPGVTLAVSFTGTAPTGGGSAANPDSDTPLYNEFNGYCWFDDSASGPQSAIQVKPAATTVIHYTFSGLDPNKRYKFKGGAVRGGSYPDRWTVADITGADGFTPNHQNGACAAPGVVLTTANVTDGTLTGSQVAINTGVNTCGAMFEWDEIAPGSDGTFAITCSQYTGTVPGGSSASTSYGYAISGLSLEETDTSCPGGTFGATLFPTNATVSECSPFTLTASICGGQSPYTAFWFKNDQPVEGAPTDTTLSFAKIASTDAGSYYAMILDANSLITYSSTTEVAVVTDTTAPAMVAAHASDFTTILVSFSRPIEISGPSAFTVVPTNGVGALSINTAEVTNQTNVLITTTTPRENGKFYKVVANSGIQTCSGQAVPVGSFVTVIDHLTLMSLTGYNWQFNQTGTEITDWLNNGYDDHSAGWETGSGVFDNVAGGRTVVGGQSVGTVILLTNTASTFAQNLPSYYFRTHINFPAGVDPDASSVIMRYMVDDGIIVYLNGNEIFRTINITNDVNNGFSQYLVGGGVGTAALSTNVLINPSLFNDGDNVIAVYLKQVNATSSDVTFGMQITANITNYLPNIPQVEVVVTPASATVAQCGALTLTAEARYGKRPYNYQWFKGSTELTGQTGIELNLNNIQTTDAGNYRVRVTDSATTPSVATSADVSVTVTPATAPVLLSALAQADGQAILLTFDKAVAITSATGGNFSLSPSVALATSFVTNVNQVVLLPATALGLQNYDVTIGAGVTGTCGSFAASGSMRIVRQVILLGAAVNADGWQYNMAGENLETAWLANNYDDHGAGWQTGTNVFDGKTPQPPGRTTIGGETVATQLSLTNANFPTTGAVIPSYYFRKHFNFPYDKADASLAFRSMFDDFGVIYLNSQEAYRDTNIVATNYAFNLYVELGDVVGNGAWSSIRALPSTNVAKGDNIVAVYLKQATDGSSDITMGLEVSALVTNFPPLGPSLSVVDNGTTVTVSWSPAGTGTLYYTIDLGAAPNTWTSSGTANPQTFNKANATYRFFQVR